MASELEIDSETVADPEADMASDSDLSSEVEK